MFQKSAVAVYLTLFLTSFIFSCSSEQSGFGNSSETASGTTTSSSESTTDTASETVTLPTDYSTNEFFVSLDASTTYPYYVSKMNTSTLLGTYGSKCSIDTSTTQNDIVCVVEAPELSLFHGGIKMAINVPAGACDYVRTNPYWYYNQEIGKGASSIALKTINIVDADGNLLTTAYRYSDDGGSTWLSSGSFTELYFDSSNAPICRYKCCTGDYTFTQVSETRLSTVTGALQDSTSTSSELSWGTSYKSCLGGAGATSWSNYSKNTELPIPVITESKDGYTDGFTVAAPINTADYKTNIPVANFYSYSSPAASSKHYHTGYGSLSGNTSTLPYFIEPISDRSGDAVTKGNPYYEFLCLDHAYELKQRIRIVVREWDTYANFLSYTTNGSTTSGAWHVVGDEGTDCSGLTPEVCDDMFSSDSYTDYIEDLLSTSYSGISASNRGYYFPKESNNE